VNRLSIAGPAALTRLANKVAADLKHPVTAVEEICPYSDQFALNMIDVPSIWIYRPTHTSGNWFFHSQHDRLDVVSPEILVKQADYAFELLQRIGNADKLPFRKALPNKLRREVETAVKQFHDVDLRLGKG